VFTKNGFQKVGDTCKSLKLDHALKCYAQLAISKTFFNLSGTHWQDHTWYFGADWIVKKWTESGFTHNNTEGCQYNSNVQQSGNQEEHPDGRTTGGSGGIQLSKAMQEGTKCSSQLIVFSKWIAGGTRAIAGTGEHAATTRSGEHRNIRATTTRKQLMRSAWMAMFLMVGTCLQPIIIWCTSGRKSEQRRPTGGDNKLRNEGGTRRPWPSLEAETLAQEATNDKPQLANSYEKFRV